MNYLNKITSSPYQQFFLTGITGIQVTMTLRYMPYQQIWTMDIQQGTFEVYGIQIVAAPNILRNYRNIIDFGITCLSTDSLDPLYVDDFSNQRCGIYLLDKDEVATIEASYFS